MAKVDDLLQAGPKQIILTIVARLAKLPASYSIAGQNSSAPFCK